MPTRSSHELLSHAGFLRALVLGMVGRQDVADDLLQDVWVAALAAPPRATWDPRRWLGGVARNIARQNVRERSRRAQRERSAARSEAVPGAGDTVDRLDLLRAVVTAVEHLDEPYRDVIMLRFFDALPPREIAKRLAVPVETVRTRQRRALEQLRGRLDTIHGDRAAWSAALTPFALHGAPSVSAITGPALMTMPSKLALGGLVLVCIVLGFAYYADATIGDSAIEAPAVASSELKAAAETDSTPAKSGGAMDRRTIDAAPRLRITGKVFRNLSEPYPGARVVLRLWNGFDMDGSPDRSSAVTTGADGRFEWEIERPEGTVRVHAGAGVPARELRASRDILVVAGDPDPPPMTLGCYSLDCDVTGRVTAKGGEPIEGAHIKLFFVSATSGKNGTYHARVASAIASQNAEVYARGFAVARQIVRLHPGKTQRLDFELDPGFEISGRVTSEDGEPVVGARFSPSWSTADREGITDLDGHYRLTCLQPAPKISLRVSHPEFLKARATIVSAISPVTKDFVLRRGSRVLGIVVNENGDPIPGARVNAYDTMMSISSERSTITREDGRFALRGVSAGEKNLLTSRRGFAPTIHELTLADGQVEATDVRIEMAPGIILSGRVIDEDRQPVEGVRLYAVGGRDRYAGPYFDDRAHTDADGHFRLRDLPEGPVTVCANGQGWREASLVVERTDRNDLEILIRRAGGLAGTVLDGATGEPVTNFRIRFVPPKLQPGDRRGDGYSSTWSQRGQTFTSDSGEWDTGRETLETGTVFGIEVTAPGYAPLVVPRMVVAAPPVRTQMRLDRGDALIGSVVSAADDQPIVGAVVRVLSPNERANTAPSGTDGTMLRAITDRSGGFRFEQVPSGSLRLQVRHAEWPIHVSPPFDSRAPRTLRLGAGARIRGVVLGDDDRPVPNARVSLNPESRDNPATYRQVNADAQGVFSFDRVPPGSYRLGWVFTHDYTSIARRSYRVRATNGGDVQVRMAKRTGGRRVSGSLVGAEELPSHTYVTLIPRTTPKKSAGSEKTGAETPSFERIPGYVGVVRDRGFQFFGVPPGRYLLYVNRLGKGPEISGMQDIDVAESSDLTIDVVVRVKK